jgi:hypothetical protein
MLETAAAMFNATTTDGNIVGYDWLRKTKRAAVCFLFIHWIGLNVCRQKAADLSVDISAETEQIDGTLVALSVKLIEEDIWDHKEEPTDEEMRCLFEIDRLDHAWRRPCCMTETNYICNADSQTKVGDVIALLQTLAIPVVLRPVGDKFQLVGDAYVSGAMHGEAYENRKHEDVDYEIRLVIVLLTFDLETDQQLSRHSKEEIQ